MNPTTASAKTETAEPTTAARAAAQLKANPAAARRRRPRKPKVTCEDCFFKRNLLCALDVAEPCPTFRHNDQGLKPPQQLSFVFRQERTRTAWSFEDRR